MDLRSEADPEEMCTLASKQIGSDTAATYSNYTTYGDAKTVTSPSGNAWNYTFDAFSNKLTETPPTSGPVGGTSWTYDEWNRLIKTSFADSTNEECFLGVGSVILPGVHLGRHCVVGANSVVTKSMPLYTVCAGAPRKNHPPIRPHPHVLDARTVSNHLYASQAPG